MHGEIIAIGDEILSGKVLNTNANFSARSLFHAGYEIKRITSVGDDPDAIEDVLLSAVKRSRFIIITGGLGPTTDDITNEAVARALGLRLVENPKIKRRLKEASHTGYVLSKDQIKRLTHLPEGAEVLSHRKRSAGYMLKFQDTLLFLLPGVPQQLEEHVRDQVIPRLKAILPSRFLILQKTFKVFGLSEPEINRQISALDLDERRVLIGYYPNFPEVFVTVIIKGEDKERVKAYFQDVTLSVREVLGSTVVAEDDETLEGRVGQLLLKKKALVALAESCTGGLIASRITSVPGSSQWFERGAVTYSNQAKMDILGVRKETLLRHGAVSQETCLEMVGGLKATSQAHYFIAVTGIAGPTGGSPEKPVGTVFIGLGSRDFSWARRFSFRGTRTMIQSITAETALDLLRRELEK